MSNLRSYLIFFILVVLVAAVLASFWLKPRQLSQLGLSQGESERLGAASCDAAQAPCRFTSKQGSITLYLEPPVKSLQPFPIRLTSQDIETNQFIVTFTMVGMEMGLNRFVLKHEGGEWLGRAMLPVCTEARNDWLATVNFVEDGKAYRVEFPFTSQ